MCVCIYLRHHTFTLCTHLQCFFISQNENSIPIKPQLLLSSQPQAPIFLFSDSKDLTPLLTSYK